MNIISTLIATSTAVSVAALVLGFFGLCKALLMTLATVPAF